MEDTRGRKEKFPLLFLFKLILRFISFNKEMNFITRRNIVKKLHYDYTKFGGKLYTISEKDTILQHSIKSAVFCKKIFECEDNIIPIVIHKVPEFRKHFTVACLLHDYGHIVSGIPIDPKSGIDDKHELKGAYALKKMGFPPVITQPIALHVLAKRYLAIKSHEYLSNLSEGSKLSLKLQENESFDLKSFEKHPYFSLSIFLRLIDDESKNWKLQETDPKTIEDFGHVIEEVFY
jgi:predicted HD phosphohydrolase